MAEIRDTKYIPQPVGPQGSWNPDSALELIGDAEFSDIRNLRQETIGEYQIRSNYKDYSNLTSGAVGLNAEVICTLEYKYVDKDGHVTSFDMTFIHDGANIKAVGLCRSKIVGSTYWAFQFNRRILRNSDDSGDLVIPTSLADSVRGFAVQYGADIALTIYNLGVYVVYPVAGSNFADKWTFKQIGKDRATTPQSSFPKFADDYNGDLFLVLYDDNFAGGNVTFRAHHFTPKKLDPGQKAESIFPALQYIRIPLSCKYFNSNNTAFDNATDLRLWQFSQNDPPVNNRPNRSMGHLQERGWGYRTVFVHKYTDSRGNKITWRSLASVDFWVRNEVYCPPQVFMQDSNSPHARIQQMRTEGGSHPHMDLTCGGPRFVFSDSILRRTRRQFLIPTLPPFAH